MSHNAKSTVLIMSDRWGSPFQGGIPVAVRLLSDHFHSLGLKTKCTVLKKTNEEEREAKTFDVELICPTPRGSLSRKNPKTSWLLSHESYFPDLRDDTLKNVKIILGFGLVTSEATKFISIQEYPNAKYYIANLWPPDEILKNPCMIGCKNKQEVEKHIDILHEDIDQADVLISMDESTFEYFKMRVNDTKHCQCLPKPIKKYFDLNGPKIPKGQNPEYHILSFLEEHDLEDIASHKMLAKAMNLVAEKIKKMHKKPIKWRILRVPEGKDKIVRDKLNPHQHLEIIPLSHSSTKYIERELQSCHLVLIPESPGMNSLNLALSVMAIGVPLFVEEHSPCHDLIMRLLSHIESHKLMVVDMKDPTALESSILRIYSEYGRSLNTASDIKKHLKTIADNSGQFFSNSSFLSKVKKDTHIEQNCARGGPSNISQDEGRAATENIQVVQPITSPSNQPMVEERKSPLSPKRRRLEHSKCTSRASGCQMRGNNSDKAGDKAKKSQRKRAQDSKKACDSCAKVPPNKQGTTGTAAGQTGKHHSKKGGAEAEPPPGQIELHVNITGGIPDRGSTMEDVEQAYTILAEVQISARNELDNLHPGIHIQNVSINSVIYTMRCDSLAALEFLWNQYETLELNKLITSITVTEKTLKEIGAWYLELQTTLDIEEYDKSKVAFLSKGEKILLLLLLDIDPMKRIIRTAEMNAPVIFNSEECTIMKGKEGDILKLKVALTEKVQQILSCRQEILAILGVRRYRTVTDIGNFELSDSELEGELITNGTKILSITHPVSLQAKSLLPYGACPKQVKICNTCKHYRDLAQSVQIKMKDLKQEIEEEKAKSERCEYRLKIEQQIYRELSFEEENMGKIDAKQKMSMLEKKLVESLKEKALVEQEKFVLENQCRQQKEKIASSEKEISFLKCKLVERPSRDIETNINELQSKLKRKRGKKPQIEDKFSVMLESQSDSKLQKQVAKVQELARDSTVEGEEPKRSVLILNDEWGTTKGGISTVHREISVLVKETGADVYSTVLEAVDVDKVDAQQKGITLITPTINPFLPSDEKTPHLSWFLLYKSFFPDLVNIPNVKFIIGHTPITNEAAILIKENFPKAEVYLFNHVIPDDIEAFKDTWTPEIVQERERKILDSAGKAAGVVSVGPRMFDYFNSKFRALNPAPLHIEYIPRPSQNFFGIQMKNLPEIKTMRVITFGRIRGVEKLKGYDLVAVALSEVASAYHDVFESAPVWVIRGIPEHKHKEIEAFLKRNIRNGHLDVKLHPYGSQDDIIHDLQESHLCIMPSGIEPFGLVGLEAIAAGIPTLITKHSGLAQYLEQQFAVQAKSMVVGVSINDFSKEDDIEKWKTEIIRVLRQYGVVFKRAQELKKELENSSAAEKSHEAFKKLILQ